MEPKSIIATTSSSPAWPRQPIVETRRQERERWAPNLTAETRLTKKARITPGQSCSVMMLRAVSIVMPAVHRSGLSCALPMPMYSKPIPRSRSLSSMYLVSKSADGSARSSSGQSPGCGTRAIPWPESAPPLLRRPRKPYGEDTTAPIRGPRAALRTDHRRALLRRIPPVAAPAPPTPSPPGNWYAASPARPSSPTRLPCKSESLRRSCAWCAGRAPGSRSGPRKHPQLHSLALRQCRQAGYVALHKVAAQAHSGLQAAWRNAFVQPQRQGKVQRVGIHYFAQRAISLIKKSWWPGMPWPPRAPVRRSRISHNHRRAPHHQRTIDQLQRGHCLWTSGPEQKPVGPVEVLHRAALGQRDRMRATARS